MRILCLHGSGTSASIFESQTAAFRLKLDETKYHFDFVDAPFRSAPAPGISALFGSSNFSWWKENTVEAIRASHHWLDEYLEDNGPYDALCGFSQGCSLISTYALYHARDKPGQPLPFKAAIFICGGVPLVSFADLGLPVSERAWAINDSTGKALHKKAGMLAEYANNVDAIQRGVGLWDDKTDLQHDPYQSPDPADVFGIDMTKLPEKSRINIPTVHVIGGKDPRWPNGMQLVNACTNRSVYDHHGGHEIPRSTIVSVKIAAMIEKALKEVF